MYCVELCCIKEESNQAKNVPTNHVLLYSSINNCNAINYGI